jgi:HD-like signal output (HDOD) protein
MQAPCSRNLHVEPIAYSGKTAKGGAVKSRPKDLPQVTTQKETLAFLEGLAHELSSGRVELPSFPDVVVRVRSALADDNYRMDQLARITSAEPALAARLLEIANSAAFHRGRKKVTELRSAILRLGNNMVRNVAMSFALSQMHHAHKFRAIAPRLAPLWRRSTVVAAIAYVLARDHTLVNRDEALLAGLLHNIGQLYIYSRVERYPRLFDSESTLEQIVKEWHPSIGRSIVESWEFPEELAEAIGNQRELERQHEGLADLSDVLIVALVLADMRDSEQMDMELDTMSALGRLVLNSEDLVDVMAASEEEIRALDQALGNAK